MCTVYVSNFVTSYLDLLSACIRDEVTANLTMSQAVGFIINLQLHVGLEYCTYMRSDLTVEA